MEGNPFEDLASLRVMAGSLSQQPARKRRKKWRRQYVQFPWAWIDRLQTAKRVSTYRLALLLVYEHWRTKGRPIALSNVMALAEGLSRRSKWRALSELEALGLIAVGRRQGRAPRLVLRKLGCAQT